MFLPNLQALSSLGSLCLLWGCASLSLLNEGDQAALVGDWRGALDHYEEAFELDEDEPRLRERLRRAREMVRATSREELAKLLNERVPSPQNNQVCLFLQGQLSSERNHSLEALWSIFDE
ncbi:MAG: hypothetical protein VYD19_06405, partial [Myxococcota bacterium]|nr:hypothetical protein [Myxococcota bacterium]